MQFVDIHCHLLPGIDDGAGDLATSLAMAHMASQDGTGVIICTPHQLGNYECNSGNSIRDLVAATQAEIDAAGLPLKLMPGADVRIESGMMQGLRSGDVLTLGDLGKHVLLELPHELYFPIGEVLQKLSQMGMQGILSHPERNAGLLARPALVAELVQQGCLMQVTAGSLVGSMGPASKRMAESLLLDGLVHFLATDAHGTKSRRPLMRRAFERSAELVGESTAELICCTNPGLVALGQPIKAGVVGAAAKPRKKSKWFSWA